MVSCLCLAVEVSALFPAGFRNEDATHASQRRQRRIGHQVTEGAPMLLPEMVTANVVQGQAESRHFGPDDRVLIWCHHPGRRDTADCQKQNGAERNDCAAQARTHDPVLHQFQSHETLFWTVRQFETAPFIGRLPPLRQAGARLRRSHSHRLPGMRPRSMLAARPSGVGAFPHP